MRHAESVRSTPTCVNAISALAAAETKLVVTGSPINEGVTAPSASPTGLTSVPSPSRSRRAPASCLDVGVPNAAAWTTMLRRAYVDAQFIDVVAGYNGDAHHQNSRSTSSLRDVGYVARDIATGTSISFSQRTALPAFVRNPATATRANNAKSLTRCR